MFCGAYFREDGHPWVSWSWTFAIVETLSWSEVVVLEVPDAKLGGGGSCKINFSFSSKFSPSLNVAKVYDFFLYSNFKPNGEKATSTLSFSVKGRPVIV